ncbi:MAG TPA: hypothetical protein VM223_04570 [Planctomycetota bacterium]|nr:hypothetical protein [Planctomycetota bacterium]
MANVVLNPKLQEYGAGSEIALALKQYSGITLQSYLMALVATKYALKKDITGKGNSYQFPATARVSAEEHTAGTELAGNNQPEIEERTITVDNKQLMSHRYFDEVQEFIGHFDTRRIAAQLHGHAVGKEVDNRMLRMIALGARQTATGAGDDEFRAGNRVQADIAGAVTVAYPKTLNGSEELQDDFEEIGRDMDDKDVPDNARVAFLTPYLRDVLLADKSIVSHDYQDQNTMLTQKVLLVKRFRIELTNNMPSTNVVVGEAAYQGDFSKTVALFIGDGTAIGQVTTGGGGVRPITPVWIDRVQSWLQGAKILQGCKWLRPEACGELYLQ